MWAREIGKKWVHQRGPSKKKLKLNITLIYSIMLASAAGVDSCPQLAMLKSSFFGAPIWNLITWRRFLMPASISGVGFF